MKTKLLIAELSKLLAYCIEQTDKGNHCFFDYAGHVSFIHIKCYLGEWEQFKEPAFYEIIRKEDIDAESIIQKIDQSLNSITICI